MCNELDAESSALELETLRLRCVSAYGRLLTPQFAVIAGPLRASLRRMAASHQQLFVALHRSMLKLPTGAFVWMDHIPCSFVFI
jgi:hypothetical protein